MQGVIFKKIKLKIPPCTDKNIMMYLNKLMQLLFKIFFKIFYVIETTDTFILNATPCLWNTVLTFIPFQLLKRTIVAELVELMLKR